MKVLSIISKLVESFDEPDPVELPHQAAQVQRINTKLRHFIRAVVAAGGEAGEHLFTRADTYVVGPYCVRLPEKNKSRFLQTIDSLHNEFKRNDYARPAMSLSNAKLTMHRGAQGAALVSDVIEHNPSLFTPFECADIACVGGCRLPIAEPIILQDVQAALKYATFAMSTRWPELEAKLIRMGDPNLCVEYADRVVLDDDGNNKRWTEGEPIILKDAKATYTYLDRTQLNERWPEFERAYKDATSKQAVDTILAYIKSVNSVHQDLIDWFDRVNTVSFKRSELNHWLKHR